MTTKAFFPCVGGSNLILGTGTQNQIFILITPATIKFFHQILKKLSLWCKKKSFLTHMDLYDPYMVPYSIHYGYYNLPRSAKKIKFFNEISSSGKNCRFTEIPKI